MAALLSDVMIAKSKNTERNDDDWDSSGNDEAAGFIGVAPSTMKQSRSTGLLLGKPAPKYSKRGRLVRYRNKTLRKWVRQFQTYRKASEAFSSNKEY